MKLKFRHKIAAAVFKPTAWVYCKIKYNAHFFRFKSAKRTKKPYLIVSNHNSDIDPVMLSLCFPFPVFYVASDHIFRWGIISRLISYLFSPIPKLKSISDIGTLRDIFSSLRSGASVCVFPEGQRSWCGETEEIMPSIGKLAYRAGVPLLTCRIHGGYYSTPRWGEATRKGRIACEFVGELTPEEIKAMGPDKLNEAIARDLYVNADREQEKDGIEYKGKYLAESIERVLHICPRCGRLAAIKSKGDEAFCECGLRFRIDRLGRLIGAPFATIAEWNRWQRDKLREKLLSMRAENPAALIFSDINQSLCRFKKAKKYELLQKGRFLMYTDRFAFEGENGRFEFGFKSVVNADICGKQIFQFSTNDGGHYEIRAKKPRSAYKYLQAYKILNA